MAMIPTAQDMGGMGGGAQDAAMADAILSALAGNQAAGAGGGGMDIAALLGGGGGMGMSASDMDKMQQESDPAYLIDRTTEAILNEPNMQAKTQLAKILIQLLQYQSGKS